MQIDPKKIHVFTEVAKLGSISLAAKRLFRTQSAVTQQVQSLEKEMGLALFDRKHRKLILTREGKRLLTKAEPLLHQFTDLIHDIKGDSTAAQGTLRIGVPQSLQRSFAEHVAKPYGRKYPRVGFDIVTGYDDDLEPKLQRHELDFAYIVNFQDKHLFETQEAFIFKEGICQSVDSPYPIHQVEDLLSAPLIDFDEYFRCYRAFFRKFAPRSLAELKKFRPSSSAPCHSMVANLVEANLGIGLVPDHVARQYHGIKMIHPDKKLNVSVDLAWNKNMWLRQFENDFIELSDGLVI